MNTVWKIEIGNVFLYGKKVCDHNGYWTTIRDVIKVYTHSLLVVSTEFICSSDPEPRRRVTTVPSRESLGESNKECSVSHRGRRDR